MIITFKKAITCKHTLRKISKRTGLYLVGKFDIRKLSCCIEIYLIESLSENAASVVKLYYKKKIIIAKELHHRCLTEF